MKLYRLFILLIGAFALAGCGPEVEIGYKPPVPIPLRISINTQGELNIGLSSDIATPIGTFDISGGTSINTLKSRFNSRVLIVRVDDEVFVYELEEGKVFSVTFDDNNTLYRKVGLFHEINGDIVLELESENQTARSDGEEPASNPEIEIPDPEDFIYSYFNDVIKRRNYDYLWTLSTDDFKQRNSDGSYRDFVDFWDTVDQVTMESVSCSNQSTTRAICPVVMTWHVNGNDVFLDVEYNLLYDNAIGSWIFD